MRHRCSMVALLALLSACQRSDRPKTTPSAPAAATQPGSPGEPGVGQAWRSPGAPEKHWQAGAPPASAPESKRVAPLAVCRANGSDPLSAARRYYDEGKYEEALSCAAQASALLPDDPQAHSERGVALTALARYEEAEVAYARALALDPDHLDALLGAARLYGIYLPSTRERDELAVVYAEHGLAEANHQSDRQMQVELALAASMAFNDLGQAHQALERAERVLSLERGNRDAAYERAIALFELCRFQEARTAFTPLLEDRERSAHAHQHLGLLLEREGKWKQAERHFSRARELAPGDFPPPVEVQVEAFRAAVAQAVAELPEDMRRDLAGVPVTAEELPRDDDLLSGEPPLSPAILGLFRGPPLGDACTREESPCRSVALYRRNLARAVRSPEELREQIRITLLHEVGHLRGEDDFELAARGLE